MRSDPSPMNVLYIDNSHSFGGAILSLETLVADLDEARYRATIVSGQSMASLTARFPSAEVQHIDQKLPWRDNAIHTTLRSLPGFESGLGRRLVDRLRAAYWLVTKDLPLALAYVSIAKRVEADIIHLNNNVESQFAGLLAARIAGLPCVAHNRSFQEPGRALRWYAGMVDRHIAISSAVRENLIEVGADPASITVIHNAVDVEAIRADSLCGASRADFEIAESDLVFGLVGRVVRWKGTLEFVRAAMGVMEDVSNARALIVGDWSDGDRGYFRAVRKTIGESGLENRIILTGYRDDPAAMMNMMDVVVHASIEPEPFGRVLIEGMALGKPVVATRGGGTEDIVVDGVGTLVPRAEPDAMRAAITRLLRDPEARKTMGERALERTRRCFSSRRHARKVMEVYDGMLASGRKGGSAGVAAPA